MRASENTVRELRLLARANDQWGLLTYDHLTAEGLDRGAIRARRDCGRLTRIHERVYSWGHSELRDEARWLAALWSCGRDTTLSHDTAVAFHGWRPQEEGAPLHLSTTRSLKGDDTMRVHRIRRMEGCDLFRPRHLVVTTVPRTIVDMADRLTWAEFRALADAVPTLRMGSIRAAQRRAPNRRGAPLVTRLIEADDAHTKSDFERRYQRFGRAAGLPAPTGLNVRIAGHKADCVYADHRLVVELDGRAFHRRRSQMRADRARDTDYQLAGFRIARLVWDDLHPDEAPRTAARLLKLLTLGGPCP